MFQKNFYFSMFPRISSTIVVTRSSRTFERACTLEDSNERDV